MIRAASKILDEFGSPMAATPRIRPELFEQRPPKSAREQRIAATYDAARESDDFKNYWANADNFDADSANSQAVRAKLVARSRYEVGNNGYMDGIVQTWANYTVGKGPTLRMLTGNRGFNETVEAIWGQWSSAILLRRKLWCMAHAKVQDGEAFGVLGTNPAVNHRIKLDLRLLETEQCQTPFLQFGAVGYVDGIKFDEWGNALWYDILPYHPGATSNSFSAFADPERIPAEFVLHWFTLRRPGQHRAVPEFRSTLNVGAASRRFREATVAAAESAADFNILIKTTLNPDQVDAVSPMSTLDIQKRMMTALPMGYDPYQMEGKHPNASYESFNRQQLNETARPKSVPYNVAACDSSDSNFASGKLDWSSMHAAVDIDREDGNDLVLDRMFPLFWQEARLEYGWNTAPLEPPAHSWNWPRHPVGDEKAAAIARDTNLRNGSISLSKVYDDQGLDFEDEVARMANDYGITVPEMKAVLLKSIFAPGFKAAPTELDPDAVQEAMSNG